MSRTPQLPFVSNEVGLGVPVVPALPPELAYTQGNIWHVKPYSGSDVNSSGKNPASAFKTLQRALAAAVANQNDIILAYSEGNTGSLCSFTQAAQLDWNKDLVHLIGVHSGVNMSSRLRIASSAAYSSALPVVKLSANGCYIRGVEFVLGSTNGTCLGAVRVTGQRNKIVGSHIYGFGNAAQDIVGAYSLMLDGAEENQFIDCTIGSDRLAQGAQANSQIKVANLAKNNRFINSVIRLCSTSATTHVFLRVPSGSLDGALEFIGTIGVNSKHRNVGAAELTYAMIAAADAGGDVIIGPGSAFQAANMNSTDAGNVYGSISEPTLLVPLTQ